MSYFQVEDEDYEEPSPWFQANAPCLDAQWPALDPLSVGPEDIHDALVVLESKILAEIDEPETRVLQPRPQAPLPLPLPADTLGWHLARFLRIRAQDPDVERSAAGTQLLQVLDSEQREPVWRDMIYSWRDSVPGEQQCCEATDHMRWSGGLSLYRGVADIHQTPCQFGRWTQEPEVAEIDARTTYSSGPCPGVVRAVVPIAVGPLRDTPFSRNIDVWNVARLIGARISDIPLPNDLDNAEWLVLKHFLTRDFCDQPVMRFELYEGGLIPELFSPGAPPCCRLYLCP